MPICVIFNTYYSGVDWRIYWPGKYELNRPMHHKRNFPPPSQKKHYLFSFTPKLVKYIINLIIIAIIALGGCSEV